MTGIVLVCHGSLGEALQHEVENIVSHPVNLQVVAVSYRASVEETLAAIHAALAQGRDAQGAILLTDLPGATPHNLAVRAAEGTEPVISGINLPMLLKAINHSEKPPQALAELAMLGGQQGMVKT